jgi:carboxyl-terminal processing protease
VKGAGGQCDCLHESTAIVGCLTAGIKLSKLPTSPFTLYRSTFFPMRPVRALRFLVLPVCAFAGGACATVLSGPRSAHGDTPYAAVEQLGRVLVEVENEYVDPVDRAKLVDGAIKGMVAELDPHSSYMPPDEFQSFESDTEGEFGGIGIEVENRNEQLIVLAPIEGSPAERAGIKNGDIIVSVDGKDPGSDPLDKLVKRLRGAPGSHVKMGVRRTGVNEILTFDLVREVIHVPSVASKLLVDRVAYVRVKQFQERTHDELLEAAAKLRSRAGGKLSGIILDLRADPGGLVDQAADVADEFLDDGVIYTARHRGQIVDEVKSHSGGAFVHEPLVVLVDQWTASASELVAGALQDHKRGTVVGEPTFGKGSVQAIVSLPGGAGMRLTVSRYYTPSGRAIQADGVHPDVAVERPKTEGLVSYREKDLEGHLAAQESGGTQATKPKSVVVVGGDAGAPGPDVGGSDAKNVADDPEKGTDEVLKVGWRVLRQSLTTGAPPTK